MRLSQLFSGETHTDSGTRIQPAASQNNQLNQQLRALTPGQTISGEIVAKNGGEVQIKISDDMILTAKVDQNINIELGKNMTFEVKSNGVSLTLSPLFTNVSTGMNVLKAIEMAALPVNENTISMTEQLMSAGLPVNKNTLMQIYREINTYSQAEIIDIITMHKLNIPVNEANVNQMLSYRNLTHQISNGMETIFGTMPEVTEALLQKGDVSGAAKVYQELFAMVQGADESVSKIETVILNGARLAEATGKSIEEVLSTANLRTNNVGSAFGTALQGNVGQNPATQGIFSADAVRAETSVSGDFSMSLPLRGTIVLEVIDFMNSLQLPPEEANLCRTFIMQFAEGKISVEQFLAEVKTLTAAAGDDVQAMRAMQKLFTGREFQELLLGQLKKQWLITPKEVGEEGKVEELYRRMDSQLKELTHILENVGQQESRSYQAVTNMSQNIDFMQQINQMYAYVQLPLKLHQGEAHGELFVYANRKNLAENDGTISAVLHLDMEHLGPVDVYVTLQSSKVSTKFYVRDDEMLDFLEMHMDLLTERLQKKGYDCSFSMISREEGESEDSGSGVLDSIIGQEKGVVLSQYAFDVRT